MNPTPVQSWLSCITYVKKQCGREEVWVSFKSLERENIKAVIGNSCQMVCGGSENLSQYTLVFVEHRQVHRQVQPLLESWAQVVSALRSLVPRVVSSLLAAQVIQLALFWFSACRAALCLWLGFQDVKLPTRWEQAASVSLAVLYI